MLLAGGFELGDALQPEFDVVVHFSASCRLFCTMP
jgi:hypothetical protein